MKGENLTAISQVDVHPSKPKKKKKRSKAQSILPSLPA